MNEWMAWRSLQVRLFVLQMHDYNRSHALLSLNRRCQHQRHAKLKLLKLCILCALGHCHFSVLGMDSYWIFARYRIWIWRIMSGQVRILTGSDFLNSYRATKFRLKTLAFIFLVLKFLCINVGDRSLWYTLSIYCKDKALFCRVAYIASQLSVLYFMANDCTCGHVYCTSWDGAWLTP